MSFLMLHYDIDQQWASLLWLFTPLYFWKLFTIAEYHRNKVCGNNIFRFRMFLTYIRLQLIFTHTFSYLFNILSIFHNNGCFLRCFVYSGPQKKFYFQYLWQQMHSRCSNKKDFFHYICIIYSVIDIYPVQGENCELRLNQSVVCRTATPIH